MSSRIFLEVAAFRVVACGCSNLTHQATLKVWSTNITLIDLTWGALLSATGAVAGFFASRLVAE